MDDVAPLASFTLVLTDLAVAMLDAPTSVELRADTTGGAGMNWRPDGL